MIKTSDAQESTKNNKSYILELNFNLDKGIIEERSIQIGRGSLKNYLWIGNASSHNPQDRLTTNNLEYILYRTIPNLYKELGECQLKFTLKKILDEFFIYRDEVLGEKNVYILDIRKFEKFNEFIGAFFLPVNI